MRPRARLGIAVGCIAVLGTAAWLLLPSLLIRLPGRPLPRVRPPREVEQRGLEAGQLAYLRALLANVPGEIS